MPLSIKGTLNWQEYLSEKEKNAGKWSREGKKRPESDVFFFRTIFGRGDGQPPVKGGGAKEKAEKL